MSVTAVIMAGGKGERFWPRSRVKLPKQLLKLTGEDTMIQQTVKRLSGLADKDGIFVVTNEDYVQTISQQLPEIKTENILVEPMSRNTAACLGLAALHIEKHDPEAVMVVIPSDHLIKDDKKFMGVVRAAVGAAASSDSIVTIGVLPSYAETGYGYIHVGARVNDINGHSMFMVDKFVEKPDRETAQTYLDSGDYLWNSGMLILKASTLRNNIKRFMPKLHSALENIRNAMDTDHEEKVLIEEYTRLDSISIDYGVLEKVDSIYVLPGDFGWDDVGTWTSLERIHQPDEDGNVIRGNILSVDTKKCIIDGSDKLIAIMGLQDVIVVDTDDVTLICSKDKAQNIKDLLHEVRKRNMEDYL